jgi:hypothetical protein
LINIKLLFFTLYSNDLFCFGLFMFSYPIFIMVILLLSVLGLSHSITVIASRHTHGVIYHHSGIDVLCMYLFM